VTCITCRQPIDHPIGEPLRLVEAVDGSVDVHARRRVCAGCSDALETSAVGAAEAWVRPARADVHLGDRHVGSLLVTDAEFPWLAGWWEEGPAFVDVAERLHRLADLHDRGDARAERLARRLADDGLTVAFADGRRRDVLLVVRPDGSAEVDTTHLHPARDPDQDLTRAV
jgi:hypothetical protein